MIRKSVAVKDGHLFIDGQDKGAVMADKPDTPNLYDSFRRTHEHNGVTINQIWVYRGDSWLCFVESDIESYGAFKE